MKNKKTDYTFTALLIPFLMAVLFNLPGCYSENKKPVYVPYFTKGQVLYPDYACSDSLIVVDAKGLNEAAGLIEQGLIEATDSNLDSTFHEYCRIK